MNVAFRKSPLNSMICVPIGSAQPDRPSTETYAVASTLYEGDYRVYVMDMDKDGAILQRRELMDLPEANGSSLQLELPTYEIGTMTGEERGSEYQPAFSEFVSTPEETKALVDAIEADPEYDPSWAKPWLREDFRAPSDPQQREALWGLVTRTWTETDGEQCKLYEYGTQICDWPDGTADIWVDPDWAGWVQYPDGSKEWYERPENRPEPLQAPNDPTTTTKLRENNYRLYHYTSETGLAGILSTGKLLPSLKADNPKDARYGDGQYLSDIVPGTMTRGQLARKFYNVHYAVRKVACYVEIDVTGLPVVWVKDRIYLVPNSQPLDISTRIRSFGATPDLEQASCTGVA